jgi:hypothetical protein
LWVRFWCQGLFHEIWIDPEKNGYYNIAPKMFRMPYRTKCGGGSGKLEKMPKCFYDMS